MAGIKHLSEIYKKQGAEFLDDLFGKELIVSEKLNGMSSFCELISHVKDRPGHDVRYAINANKINKDLGWEPQENFESGIRKTVEWYINNKKWCENIQNGSYQLERLGVNLKWKVLF